MNYISFVSLFGMITHDMESLTQIAILILIKGSVTNTSNIDNIVDKSWAAFFVQIIIFMYLYDKQKLSNFPSELGFPFSLKVNMISM